MLSLLFFREIRTSEVLGLPYSSAVAGRLMVLTGVPASNMVGGVGAYVDGLRGVVIVVTLCDVGVRMVLLKRRLSCTGAKCGEAVVRIALGTPVSISS